MTNFLKAYRLDLSIALATVLAVVGMLTGYATPLALYGSSHIGALSLVGLALGALGTILLDDVNTVTTKTIMPGVVDNFFRAGPLIAYLKTRFTRKWIGPQIQENYMYAPMRGGAYKKGATFNISKRQTRTGMLFTPRYYEVNVTEFLEDVEVEQAGPNAMFSIVKTDMAEAALTLSGILEIAAYHHG